jgi:hypothetical protein
MICVTAIVIIGIVALVLVLGKPQSTTEQAVSYLYDEQNRLQAIIPVNDIKKMKELK